MEEVRGRERKREGENAFAEGGLPLRTLVFCFLGVTFKGAWGFSQVCAQGTVWCRIGHRTQTCPLHNFSMAWKDP